MDPLSIGQLAQEAGVNIETIRFYERRGLLRNPPRTSAGYRQYSEIDVRRLVKTRATKTALPFA